MPGPQGRSQVAIPVQHYQNSIALTERAGAIADGRVWGYNYGAMRYQHPPLVEAVFEVFATPTQWPEAAEQAIEEALRRDYAGKREVLKPLGLRFQMGPGLALQGATTEEPERIRLWTPDGDRMVQFARNMCALNVLPPYRHYGDYVPELERLTGLYLDKARPSAAVVLGQRYINKVRLPRGGTPESFFEIYPALPPHVRSRHPPLSMQVEIETLEAGGNVVLTLTAKGLEEDHPVYVLDIYARTEEAAPPTWDRIRQWHEAAHGAVISAFELAITDRARELFGREG